MYLFTEYVFRESVDSAHNSQISSTFQEADCLLKLVKINKQVFAITLLSRNLNHTAELSISARGGNNNFVSRTGGGGGEETEKTHQNFNFVCLRPNIQFRPTFLFLHYCSNPMISTEYTICMMQ